MARRNAQNERYRKGAQIGKTRKSASSAKPKRSAATVETRGGVKGSSAASSAKKIPFEPDTPRFRRWRKYWLGLLVAAIVFSLGAWWQQGTIAGTAALVAAYTCLAAGIYIDLTKIRRMRREWRAEQEELAKGKKKPAKADESAAEKAETSAPADTEETVDEAEGKD